MSIGKRVWAGSLLVQIDVSEPEAVVKRYYLAEMHRISYWPQYLPEILAYFKRYLSQSTDQPWSWWLEYENRPIPWHEPMGLIFDKLCRSPDLPWQLTLRGSANGSTYPSGLLALENELTARNYWLNQAKEACYIRNGNSNAIMNLSLENIQELWKAIRNGSFETFWSICGPFIREQTMRHVPLKIYCDGSNEVIQRLVRSRLQDGRQQLFEHLLRSLKVDLDGKELYLHGAKLPLNAPLCDVYLEAMYPDGFLHVIIKNKKCIV